MTQPNNDQIREGTGQSAEAFRLMRYGCKACGQPGFVRLREHQRAVRGIAVRCDRESARAVVAFLALVLADVR